MYCTQADMEARFDVAELIQLTDRTFTGSVNAANLNQAITDAQAVIDGYLRSGGYSLPLTSVPVEVMRVCCDLARYFLHGNKMVEVVKNRRDEAVAWLRDIATGKALLGADMVGLEAAPPASGVQFTAPSRVLNSSALNGFD